MKMMPKPCAAMARSATNRPSISAGVSTAVGSSRIRMRTPRNSALTISSRCCSPTDSAETGRSGSSARPNCCSMRLRPASPPARSSRPLLPGSPTSRLSSTRKARGEVEMLVHHADAGGERIGRGADARPACLRPRSCRGRPGRRRTGCSSAWSCRRRSRRAGRGSRRRRARARHRHWRGRRQSSSRCRAFR